MPIVCGGNSACSSALQDPKESHSTVQEYHQTNILPVVHYTSVCSFQTSQKSDIGRVSYKMLTTRLQPRQVWPEAPIVVYIHSGI